MAEKKIEMQGMDTPNIALRVIGYVPKEGDIAHFGMESATRIIHENDLSARSVESRARELIKYCGVPKASLRPGTKHTFNPIIETVSKFDDLYSRIHNQEPGNMILAGTRLRNEGTSLMFGDFLFAVMNERLFERLRDKDDLFMQGDRDLYVHLLSYGLRDTESKHDDRRNIYVMGLSDSKVLK